MANLPKPFVLDWIAQPIQSQALLDRLLSPNFLILQSGITPLPTGAVRYYFIVQPLNESINRQSIEEEAQRLSYLALTFTFNMVGVSLLKQRQYAEGLEDILMAYLSCKFNLDVNEMEHIYLDRPATLILRPISRDGLSFYLSEEERLTFLNVDYESLIGYDLLTPDPLIWFYLARENSNVQKGVINSPGDPRSQWYIASWQGIAILPIAPPPEEDPVSEVAQVRDIFVEAENIEDMSTPFGVWWTDRDIFKNETNRFVSSLRVDNYFTLDLDSNLLETARDLAELWAIDYYGTFPVYPDISDHTSRVIYVFAPSRNTPENPVRLLDIPSWFKDALLKIRLGQLPLFYIGGDWVQYVEPLMENMARLQYAAIRAYNQVAETNNLALAEYVWDVKCLPNLLISAPFSALSEVKVFESLFRAYLPETRNWQVMECSDLETCTRRRLALIQEDPDLHPLGLTIPADPETTYLVIDTSAGSGTLSSQIETIKPEQANGFSNKGSQRGISNHRQHHIKIETTITFRYVPSVKATYSFYLRHKDASSSLHLMTIETEDPTEIINRMTSRQEDLLSSWGASYHKYNPERPLRRDHFMPFHLLKTKYR